MKKIYGIINFSEPILFSGEALGNCYNISIGRQNGKLILPSLPKWAENEKDPLSKELIAPEITASWKRGEKQLYWGSPLIYPSGESRVYSLLLLFEIEEALQEQIITNLYNGYPVWIELFKVYTELFTQQKSKKRFYIKNADPEDRLELYYQDDSKIKMCHYNNKGISVNLVSRENIYLKHEQIKSICELCSEVKKPKIEYRILLKAYEALRVDDYRQTILECATAVELTITNRIKKEFDSLNIKFGEKLFKKYRMLGGRFELVNLLEIPLPNYDYKELLIEPRNNIIHGGFFPDLQLTNYVIKITEELLGMFSPEISERG
ncbi:MAG: hypothetical protein KKE23_01180 [Nanoarchaeota archaeon]|nr:hypothetical protein [Nanoarchaeota archaeon]